MEYPKNTMYTPVGTFPGHGMQRAYAQITQEKAMRKSACLEGVSLAMVYSPCQHFEELYEPMEGLCRGTIFCRLDMPFTGRRRQA